MADSKQTLSQLRHDLLLLAPEKYDEETLAGLKQIESLARKMRQVLQTTE
jgi:hypothetical protein